MCSLCHLYDGLEYHYLLGASEKADAAVIRLALHNWDILADLPEAERSWLPHLQRHYHLDMEYLAESAKVIPGVANCETPADTAYGIWRDSLRPGDRIRCWVSSDLSGLTSHLNTVVDNRYSRVARGLEVIRSRSLSWLQHVLRLLAVGVEAKAIEAGLSGLRWDLYRTDPALLFSAGERRSGYRQPLGTGFYCHECNLARNDVFSSTISSTSASIRDAGHTQEGGCTHLRCSVCEGSVGAYQPSRHAGGAVHCQAHCECRMCGDCNHPVTPQTECNCGQGSTHHSPSVRQGCCHMISMRTPGSIHFTPKPRPPTKKDLKRNKMARLLGTEVEVPYVGFNVSPKMDSAIKEWKPHFTRDGSLRGCNPVEMPTQPTGGDLFLRQQADLSAGLIEMKCEQNASAGMHVHVDCNDADGWDLSRILRLYASVEAGLMALLHVSRHDNQYCRPCGPRMERIGSKLSTNPAMELETRQYGYELRWDKEGRLSDFRIPGHSSSRWLAEAVLRGHGRWEAQVPPGERSQILYQHLMDRLRVLKGDKSHGSRYNALNLHSYYYRGTLEFRHHHGTINANTMTYWPLICGSIVEWAKTHSDTQLLQLQLHMTKTAPDEKMMKHVRDLRLSLEEVPDPVLFTKAAVTRQLMTLCRITIESTGIAEVYDWVLQRLKVLGLRAHQGLEFRSYGGDNEI